MAYQARSRRRNRITASKRAYRGRNRASLAFEKEIFDNVFGFIPVTAIELEVIKHPLFQRLRHISQLGNAQYVFPGATHTRFAHSLGVMHMASTLAERIAEECSWSADELQKIRLAGLLHDIGHYPYSHAVESVYMDRKGLHHEKLGAVVLEKSSLGEAVRQNFNVDEISSIFTGTHSNYKYVQLLHSELDADRMDYLLRDSYMVGVHYGNFDADQLIRKLRLNEKGYISVDFHAKRAVEHYVLARFNMYAQVYTHKTVRSLDLMLSQLCHHAMDRNLIPDPKELDKMISDDNFVLYDDHELINVLRTISQRGSKRKRLAQMYLGRERLKCAVEITSFEMAESPEITRLQMLGDQFDLGKDYNGIPREWIFFDTDSGIKMTKLRPSFDVSEVARIEPQKAEELATMFANNIWVHNKNGESQLMLDDKSSLMKHIAGLKYDVGRVYTLDQYADKLKNRLKKR